jgi:hypothetical protein
MVATLQGRSPEVGEGGLRRWKPAPSTVAVNTATVCDSDLLTAVTTWHLLIHTPSAVTTKRDYVWRCPHPVAIHFLLPASSSSCTNT